MDRHKDVVLLVDDEPGILDALKRAFERRDKTVIVARSGEEGIRILRERKVDLVIADNRMTGMSGADMLARAREIDPDVPRIMMTAYPDIQLATDVTNAARLARFLTKPFKLDDLTNAADEALAARQLRRARQLAMERSANIAERMLRES